MDRLTLLRGLEKVADAMRSRGLHPVTRLARNLLGSLLQDLSTDFDGLRMFGSIAHRGHLYYARARQIEPFMSTLFKTTVKPGIVVLDVGAHLGYYSLLAARAGAKVFSFEPDPSPSDTWFATSGLMALPTVWFPYRRPYRIRQGKRTCFWTTMTHRARVACSLGSARLEG